MKLTLVLGTAVLAMLAAVQSPDVRFRAAQQKETVEGDLPGAIAMYRKLADDSSTPPEIAARSLLQLGRCQERLGNGEARKAYERVLSHFANQGAAVAEAKQRLAAMAANSRNATEEGVVVRKLQGNLQGYLSSTMTQDGRYAVINRGRTGLDLLDVVTGQRKAIHTSIPISAPGENFFGFAISPDGRQVAVDIGRGVSSSELRLVNTATGEVRTLMKSDTDFESSPVDWSRDGRTILVRPWTETEFSDKAAPGFYTIIGIDSGVSRKIRVSGMASEDARLSPDGRFLAYTVLPRVSYQQLAGKIYVASLDGTKNHLVAALENGAMLAGWSPDGQHLLYASDDRGTDHLWAVRIQDGNPMGEPVSITNGLARAQKLTLTASGSLILTNSGEISSYTATINPSTGAVESREKVNAKVNASIRNVIWSPDGRRMAYSMMHGTMRDQLADKPNDLYLRETGGGEERKLGAFPLIQRKMSWTPDGKALIMPQKTDNGAGVFRYWVDEGRTEQLVPAQADEHFAKGYPKLASNGRALYFLEGPPTWTTKSKLIQYDLATRRTIQIATAQAFDLAPDGEHLVIPHLDAASKQMTIQIVTSEGKPVRELVRLGLGESVMSLAWSPDGKWIYFARGTNAGVEIHRVSASGGKAVFTRLRTSTYPDLVVHPNGNQIAFLDRSGTELWRVDGLGSILAHLP